MARETFKGRLLELRLLKGLKRTDLERNCGLDSGAVKRYEDGTGAPSVTALAQMARYFNVTMDYLWGNDNKAAREGVNEL